MDQQPGPAGPRHTGAAVAHGGRQHGRHRARGTSAGRAPRPGRGRGRAPPAGAARQGRGGAFGIARPRRNASRDRLDRRPGRRRLVPRRPAGRNRSPEAPPGSPQRSAAGRTRASDGQGDARRARQQSLDGLGDDERARAPRQFSGPRCHGRSGDQALYRDFRDARALHRSAHGPWAHHRCDGRCAGRVGPRPYRGGPGPGPGAGPARSDGAGQCAPLRGSGSHAPARRIGQPRQGRVPGDSGPRAAQSAGADRQRAGTDGAAQSRSERQRTPGDRPSGGPPLAPHRRPAGRFPHHAGQDPVAVGPGGHEGGGGQRRRADQADVRQAHRTGRAAARGAAGRGRGRCRAPDPGPVQSPGQRGQVHAPRRPRHAGFGPGGWVHRSQCAGQRQRHRGAAAAPGVRPVRAGRAVHGSPGRRPRPGPAHRALACGNARRQRFRRQ